MEDTAKHEEQWPAVLCTHFDLSRCSLLWLGFPSLNTHTHTHLSHCIALHSFTATPPRLLSTPTPMPSSVAEPHNYFLWETYCLRVSLSLITIEQKGVLTGGTRRAALMLSAPGPPLFSFSFQANGRIRTYQTHCDHIASHSLWR